MLYSIICILMMSIICNEWNAVHGAVVAHPNETITRA